MSPETPIYATQTPEGGWRVAGTRVSLDSVVHAFRDGSTPEAIIAAFPSLTLEQVYGAIAFYLHNRAEIDRYLEEQEVRWQQFQQESAARLAPLVQRMRPS
jgi:uncharacterized protein (DUF433 family)